MLKLRWRLLIAAIIGVGPNIGRLWTTYEYAAETMRGKAVLKSADGEAKEGLPKDYALQLELWEIGNFDSSNPQFLWQCLSSRRSKMMNWLRRFNQRKEIQLPTYWGPQPSTSGPVYVGAIVCFLFVLGLFLD